MNVCGNRFNGRGSRPDGRCDRRRLSKGHIPDRVNIRERSSSHTVNAYVSGVVHYCLAGQQFGIRQHTNADDRLFPNQFVNVRLRVRTIQDAIVIPAAAVQFGSRGTYVFVVGDDNTVTARDVVLGPSDGTLQAIESGISAGDRVVLEGLDRLREGRKVILVDDNQPLVTPGS